MQPIRKRVIKLKKSLGSAGTRGPSQNSEGQSGYASCRRPLLRQLIAALGADCARPAADRRPIF